MKRTDFAVKVCKKEGLKRETDIAQVKEILKVINELTKGEFNQMIRKLK